MSCKKVFIKKGNDWIINKDAPKDVETYEKVREMRVDIIDRIENNKYKSDMFCVTLYLFWILCDEFINNQFKWYFIEIENYLLYYLEDITKEVCKK